MQLQHGMTNIQFRQGAQDTHVSCHENLSLILQYLSFELSNSGQFRQCPINLVSLV